MRPKPVVVTTICSECGLPWEAHGDEPTTGDCIRLLKIELAKRPSVAIAQPYVYPVYPQPWTHPYWYGTTYCNTSGIVDAIACTATSTVDYKTPTIETTCSAVSG